jgi:hypothetical protein
MSEPLDYEPRQVRRREVSTSSGLGFWPKVGLGMAGGILLLVVLAALVLTWVLLAGAFD